MSNDAPLSGTPLTITAGGYTADVASVGATLRTLRHEGRDLVVPFDADEVRPVFRGAVLAPWPNRIVDGTYTSGGVDHELALTEPARHHALHGLVAWTDFAVLAHDDDRVLLGTTIPAQQGYPHRVDVHVEYRLDAEGLHTTVTGTNTGADDAPWGTGPHPYLVAGDGTVDDWTLTLPAAEVLEVTPDRLIPTDLVPVHDEFDLRIPTLIGDRFVDHAFTGFDRDADGLAAVTVIAADGHGVRVAFDAACPWVQVHTADHVVPAYHRAGLAVEPMTCAPDAFNDGVDRGLVVLAPGSAHAAAWTIAAV
ncbi:MULTISPECIES: aldose 1-epimerase family protein [unclassified Curtobacterium]|uniref:aldose 1-epimerase family protein n=1 Tax=unclassified Curtobacterium TaxID=257496 RepID=UPI0008DD71D6|nr:MULTISPECIES: aldose 1-epimerase family protein [unclassified Curtobacterium]OIH98945.1 galactose mutarotase [Curtobacterium sp. MCBA15_003]OII09462.1 galactose mutarotase [Curtobacterium sp. MCBA15_009]OII31152.1 galactose mutarotase [Curtobacterium sp. MMLR14_006]